MLRFSYQKYKWSKLRKLQTNMHVRCRRALKNIFTLFLPDLLKKLRYLKRIILYHEVGVKKYFFTFFGCFCVLY